MPRILFDVNIPVGLRAELPNHEVITAFEMSWNTLETGGDGRAAQTCQRIVQQSPDGDGTNRTHTRAGFGNSAEFWLNIQRRNDLWEAMHSPKERARIDRARPVAA